MIDQFSSFEQFFSEFAEPKLAHRRASFKLAFEHLLSLRRPVVIVETGCVRNSDTYAQEGQSTVLFDQFSRFQVGSTICSVDISPESTSRCRSIVSDRVQIFTMDSVKFLRHECSRRIPPGGLIDLLYLDSYDIDLQNPHESAMHHFKELLAASPMVGPQTMILVDDSPSSASLFTDDGKLVLASAGKIGGKAMYIAEYMQAINNDPRHVGYQVAWMGI